MIHIYTSLPFTQSPNNGAIKQSSRVRKALGSWALISEGGVQTWPCPDQLMSHVSKLKTHQRSVLLHRGPCPETCSSHKLAKGHRPETDSSHWGWSAHWRPLGTGTRVFACSAGASAEERSVQTAARGYAVDQPQERALPLSLADLLITLDGHQQATMTSERSDM